ncbi:hypothetical protein CFP56_018788 [Quercus suber]|uniref:Uncharacterized protein n=1 Tax=Quercus suber TaxID=58331 RepID=A0AAW0KJI7_QUESU
MTYKELKNPYFANLEEQESIGKVHTLFETFGTQLLIKFKDALITITSYRQTDYLCISFLDIICSLIPDL